MPEIYIADSVRDLSRSRFAGCLNHYGIQATSGSANPEVWIPLADFLLVVLSENSINSGLGEARDAVRNGWLREEAQIISLALDPVVMNNIPTFLRDKRCICLTNTEMIDESWPELLEALGIPRFIQLVIEKDTATVERLLDGGVDVNTKDLDGRNTLWWAVYWRQIDLVHNLLERGADPNVWGRWSRTPLHCAAPNGDIEIVQGLLDKGANSNITDFLGRTALMGTGTIEIVRMLLAKGADVNIKDSYGGSTALMSAACQGYSEIIRILIDHGADLNMRNDLGRTTLIMAVGPCHIETVRILCENGADVNAKADDGKTALTIARSYNHDEIEKILLEAGAIE